MVEIKLYPDTSEELAVAAEALTKLAALRAASPGAEGNTRAPELSESAAAATATIPHAARVLAYEAMTADPKSSAAAATATIPAAAAPTAQTAPSEPEPSADPAPSDEPVTLEQVRARFAVLTAEGKSSQAKALLAEFGAAKLTAVEPKHYAELLKKAEEL